MEAAHILCLEELRSETPSETRWIRDAELERVQERHQVALFGVGEADMEPLVVEIDNSVQVFRRAVVKVRGSGGERAQVGALGLAEVLELAADEPGSPSLPGYEG